MRIIPIRAVNMLLLQRPKYWDVISVCRDDTLPLTSLCRRHTHVNCDDIFDKDMPKLTLDAQQNGRVVIPPNEGHIIQAIRFARESEMERLLIHCAMGHSRSPAIGWCILFDKLGYEEKAWAELYCIRPNVVPNNRIIRLGHQLIVNTNGSKDFGGQLPTERQPGKAAQSTRR